MNASVRDWHALNRLLDAALSLPAHERVSWVTQLGSEHEALKSILLELLARRDLSETGGFLASLPKLTAHPGGQLATFAPGQLVGPYRLERLLGTGGMGSVWLAERSDGLLKRKIALKLPHVAGATAGLAERMVRERNILASLQHPHIARLYDAGMAGEGRPYLALEYVEGEPITRYCDARALGLRARLALLVQVARAVAYAHAHLVIHRDLKPSNILVDAQGDVHLLDFGIATLLGESAAETGESVHDSLTRQLGVALTPEYASPEQVRGEPVSTASDVYALGVVLYELLAGRRPYELRGGSQLSLAEAIATAIPTAPSAAARDRTVSRLLRGDLDTIVLKALRKSPTERYATVSALADDIERYLRGRPVHARPDSLAYRMRKLVERNRTASIAASLLVVSLCAGVIGTAWQAQRAMHEERVARAAEQRAEQRFRDVRRLAHTILFDYHDAIKDLPGATPVRARLVQDALSYLDRLAGQASNDEELQRELATAYERVGDIQGGTMLANLGDTRGALQSHRKALGLRERILAMHPGNAAAMHDLALAHRNVGILQWEAGAMHDAASQVKTALALFEHASAIGAADERYELARTSDYLGRIEQEQGDAAGARRNFEKGMQLIKQLLAANPDDPPLVRSLSVFLEQLGTNSRFTGDLAGALEAHRQALQLRERLTVLVPLNADYQRTVGVSWYNIGEMLAELGEPRKALDAYRHNLTISQKLRALDPRNEEYRGDVAYASIRVGDMLLELGRSEEALASYRRSFALRDVDVRADPTNLWKRSSLIEARAKMSRALLAGHAGEAETEADATRELMAGTQLDPQNAEIRSFFATTYADLGDLYRALGVSADSRSRRKAAARDMYSRAEAIWHDMELRGALSSDDGKRREAMRQVLAQDTRH